MVPVNLRKFFPSESMLNFFGWIEPGYQFPEGDYEFEDIVRTVDAFFKQELTREKLGSHMSMYMKLEQHPILRFVPLELKNPALILANQFAEKDVTAILSNVGVVDMPPGISALYSAFWGVYQHTEAAAQYVFLRG